MRPHKLIMKNFGPFLDESLDFDALGDVVYMIVGETGAGKTMIFDAISFALFGRASGDKRSRVSLEDYYCRYVTEDDGGKKPPMEVELTFTEKDVEYRVIREISWGKTGKAGTCSVSSRLFVDGEDKTPQGGDTKTDLSKGEITRTIEKAVGLKADDFKKIVMLAQGEFQKFLEASGSERNEILGRIYDNSPHIDLQNRLASANGLLKRKMEAARGIMKRALDACTIPEKLSMDDRDRLDVVTEDTEGLFEALKNAVVLLKEECADTEKNMAQNREKARKLREKRVKAEQNNRLLDQKQKLIEEKEELDKEKEAYISLTNKLKTVSEAEKIMPLRRALEKSKKALEEAKTKGEVLSKEKQSLEEKEPEARENAAKIKAESGPRINEITVKVTRLKGVEEVYDRLENSLLKAEQLKKRQTGLEKDLAAAESVLQDTAKKIKENEELLETLQEAGEAAVRQAEAEKKKAEALVNDFLGLKDKIKAVNDKEKTVGELVDDLVWKEANTSAAQKEYDSANQRLRHGRAASLAADMVKELEKATEVKCPVCGTLHTKDDISGFAVGEDEIPSEEEVEELYKKLTDMREIEQKKHMEVSRKKGELDGDRKAALEKAKVLLKAATWEEAADEKVFDEAMNEAKAGLEASADKLNEAVRNRDLKAEALKRRNELNRKNEIDKDKKKALEADHNRSITEKAETDRDVLNARQQLKGFPESKALAIKEMAEGVAETEAINRRVSEAEQDLNNLINKLSRVKGQLAENESLVNSCRVDHGYALEQWTSGLKEHGFADENAFMTALSPEGTILISAGEVHRWIDIKTRAVTDYNNKVIENRAHMEENKKNTEGLVYTDLSAIDAGIHECDEADRELDQRSKEEYSNLKRTEENVKIIKSNMKELQKLAAVEKELRPMAENTVGRKFKFKDYVLGDFFVQIADHASDYFMELMDGKYRLMTRMHKNKSADKDSEELRDLDLLVEDAWGNSASVAMLSGGQSFEASLALALGLSEVVQMQKAGKVHIESMFIDEGFGTLDGHRLERSMHVLNSMTAQKRQIGIITHVEKLINADQYKKIEIDHKDGLSTINFTDNR
ncbi:MAG: SMC family ATPase [Lachnospiraceae bacterium]|nr:SMC family ATPase [Lachnospiraceae bacterium]